MKERIKIKENFSNRVCFVFNDCFEMEYIDEITRFTEKEILNIRNIGKISLQEIKSVLFSHGLFLQDDEKKTPLTKEEYVFLATFLENFSKDAKTFFYIIKRKYGDKHSCVKFASKAVNNMQYIKIPLQDQCENDIGYEEANKIFKNIQNFLIDGYYK